MPLHPEYLPGTAVRDQLSLVLGEIEYTAYAALETRDSWPSFWHDCQQCLEMMDEGKEDPNDPWGSAKRYELWDTTQFRKALHRFFLLQNETFLQYLGPSLESHYFAYEHHRPGGLVLVAWPKQDIAPYPKGGLVHV